MRTFTLLFLSMVALIMLTNNCVTFSETTDKDSTYMDYDEAALGYKFYEPTLDLKLEDELEETSGLAYVDRSTLATIEDENGDLYLIDSQTGETKRKIKFHKDGDYESVEIVNQTVYVMKSNGDLYYFEMPDEDEVDAEEIDTEFSSKNNLEGMGYDGEKLLIACKNSGDVDDNEVDGKAVYSFDLSEKKVSEKEAFSITEDELDAFIKDRKYFDNVKDFDPSGIAIHPITGDVYLLSADHVLVVFTKSYKLKEVVKLDDDIYRQPEGICFAPDGTLYISSEGAGKSAKLFQLLYQD